MFLNYFHVLMLKIIFFKKIYIILIYFQVKIMLKSNYNHTSKQIIIQVQYDKLTKNRVYGFRDRNQL